jgi:galactoside O-acetyltransferase
MKSNFYDESELKELGLKSFGRNVLISRKCSIYGGENMAFGNNVRIDDFCILSGEITIGNYCHIAAGVNL